MREADAVRLDAQARALFTYLPDAPGQNIWREHREDVRANRPWSGQCASLAATVVQLCWKDGGADLSDLFKLEVTAEGTSTPDHMIGCVWTDEGPIVIGDTFQAAYPAQDCPHTLFRYQCMADLTIWRDGAPWA